MPDNNKTNRVYFIKMEDGSEYEVAKSDFEAYGAANYAKDYPKSTIRMFDPKGGDWDVDLREYDEKRKQGYKTFAKEHIIVPSKTTSTPSTPSTTAKTSSASTQGKTNKPSSTGVSTAPATTAKPAATQQKSNIKPMTDANGNPVKWDGSDVGLGVLFGNAYKQTEQGKETSKALEDYNQLQARHLEDKIRMREDKKKAEQTRKSFEANGGVEKLQQKKEELQDEATPGYKFVNDLTDKVRNAITGGDPVKEKCLDVAMKMVPKMSGAKMLAGTMGRIYNWVGGWFNGDMRRAQAAIDKINDTLDKVDESKHNKDGVIGALDKQVGGFYRGLINQGSKIQNWDLGVSDATNSYTISKVVDKYMAGEPLSASEQNLLDVVAFTGAIDQAYNDQIGLGYKAGQGTAQSLGYMEAFVFNPASGVAEGIADSALRAGVEAAVKAGSRRALLGALGKGFLKGTGTGLVNTGKNIFNAGAKLAGKEGMALSMDLAEGEAKTALLRSLASRYGEGVTRAYLNTSKFLGDMVQAAALEATSGAPSTVSNVYDRRQGNIHSSDISQGEGHVTGIEREGSLGEAWGKGVLGNYFEYWTEGFGEYFDALGKALKPGKLISKSLGAGVKAEKPLLAETRAALKTKFKDFQGALALASNSDVARMFNAFKDKVKFNGVAGETGEEIANNILNAVPGLTGDMNFSSPGEEGWENSVWNPDINLELIAQIGCMCGHSYILEGGASMFRARQMNQAYNTASEMLDKSLGANAKEIKDNLDVMGDSRAAEYIQQLATQGVLNDKTKLNSVLTYSFVTNMRKGMNTRSAIMKGNQNEEDVAQDYDDAYKAGYGMDESGYRESKKDFETATQMAQEELGDQNFATLTEILEDPETNDETLRSFFSAYTLGPKATPEGTLALENFINSYSRKKGINDWVNDEIDNSVKKFREVYQPAVNLVDNTISYGTYTDPNTQEESDVFVASGFNPESATTVIVKDGEMQMVPTSTITKVQTEDADDYESKYRTYASNWINEEYAWHSNNHPNTVRPEQGLKVVSGYNPETNEVNKVIVTGQDEQSGMFYVAPVTEKFNSETGEFEDEIGEGTQLMSESQLIEMQNNWYDNIDRVNAELDEQKAQETPSNETPMAENAEEVQGQEDTESELTPELSAIKSQITTLPGGTGALADYEQMRNNGYSDEEIRGFIAGSITDQYGKDVASAITQYHNALNAQESAVNTATGTPAVAQPTAQAPTTSPEGFPLDSEGNIDFDAIEKSGNVEMMVNALESAFGGSENAHKVALNKKELAGKELKKATDKGDLTKMGKLTKSENFWGEVVNTLWEKIKPEGGISGGEKVDTSTLSADSKAIKDKWDNSTKYYGRQRTIALPDGTEIHGKYVMYEEGSATPSHNPFTWEPNPGTTDENGETNNSRNYKDNPENQRTVERNAAEYDSRALTNQPIIFWGRFMSGNGTDMSGQIAAKNNTDGKYLATLKNDADFYGFSSEQVGEFSHPRIGFEIDEDSFAEAGLDFSPLSYDRFNSKADMKQESAIEQGIKMGKVLTDDTFNKLAELINRHSRLRDVYTSKETQEAIANLFVDAPEVVDVSKANVSQYYDKADGKLTEDGRQLLESALIGYIFKGNADVLKELSDLEKKSMTEMADGMPELATIRRTPDQDISDHIANAIDIIWTAKQRGMKVKDYLDTADTEDGGTGMEVRGLIDSMLARTMSGEENKTIPGTSTPVALKNVLKSFISMMPKQGEGSLPLGDEVELPKEENLQEVLLTMFPELRPKAEEVQAPEATQEEETPQEEEPQTEEPQEEPQGESEGGSEKPQGENNKPTTPSVPKVKGEIKTREDAQAFADEKFGKGTKGASSYMKVWDMTHKKKKPVDPLKKASALVSFTPSESIDLLDSGLDEDEVKELQLLALDFAPTFVEDGAVKFPDFFKEMVSSLGDNIRPFTKSIYLSLGAVVSDDLADEMDDRKTVRAFDINTDINSIDNEQSDNLQKPEGESESFVAGGNGEGVGNSGTDESNGGESGQDNGTGGDSNVSGGTEGESEESGSGSKPQGTTTGGNSNHGIRRGNRGGKRSNGQRGTRGNVGTDSPSVGDGSLGRDTVKETPETKAEQSAYEAEKKAVASINDIDALKNRREDYRKELEGLTDSVKIAENKGKTRAVIEKLQELFAARPAEKIDLSKEKIEYVAASDPAGIHAIGSVVPSGASQAMAEALKKVQELEGKSIPEFVKDELGYDSLEDMFTTFDTGKFDGLASEQVDSLALAIHQMKMKKGFIVGDMTGIGKGRQAAALIRWGVKNGKRVLYVTENTGLFSDMYRDLTDIGSKELLPFIISSDSDTAANITDQNSGSVVIRRPSASVKAELFKSDSTELPTMKKGKQAKQYDFVMMPYSQASSDRGNAKLKLDWITEYAKDAIVILDESHNASGDSKRGAFFQNIVKNAEGVTFLSATYAKRPDNMMLYALRSSMGDANMTEEEMIEAIDKYGVPMQEILASVLFQNGEMVRRERDFSDVKTHWLDPNEVYSKEEVENCRNTADKAMEVVNAIIEFQRAYVDPIVESIEKSYADTNKAAALIGAPQHHAYASPYSGQVSNVLNLLVYGMKAKKAAELAIQQIKEGKKPIIAVENTLESYVKELPEELDGAELGMIFDKGIKFSLKYETYDTIKGKDGQYHKDDSTTKYYDAEVQLPPEGVIMLKYIKKLAKDYLRDDSRMKLSLSPIDMIEQMIETAGYTCGEITGRGTKLREVSPNHFVKTPFKADKKKAAFMFNGGSAKKPLAKGETYDAIILNVAGATGISLHSSKQFGDQRPRTMIILQPARNVNTEVQMRGRNDRTGQVHRGEYFYLTSPIPAEGKAIMMLKQKLASLDANSVGTEKVSSNKVESTDMDNKYGDRVAEEFLQARLDINAKIDGGLTYSKKDREWVGHEGILYDVLKGIQRLDCDTQDQVLVELQQRYNDLIEYLDQNGINDLKTTTLDLEATTIDEAVFVKGTDNESENEFAHDTMIERVYVNTLKKPLRSSEVLDKMKSYGAMEEGKIDSLYGMNISTEMESVVTDMLEDKKAKIEEKREKIRAKLKESYPRTADQTDEEYEKMVDGSSAMIDANTKLEREYDNYETDLKKQKNDANKALLYLKPGRPYYVPLTDDVSDGAPMMFGRFLGFKVGSKKPREIRAIFAVRDSRAMIEIPVSSQVKAIEKIISNTRYDDDLLNLGGSQYDRDITENDRLPAWDKWWDGMFAKETGKASRQIRYIISGNVIQACGNLGKYKGSIVTFTRKDGETGEVTTERGMLLAEDFDPENFYVKSRVTKEDVWSSYDKITDDDTSISTWRVQGEGMYVTFGKRGKQKLKDHPAMKDDNLKSFSTTGNVETYGRDRLLIIVPEEKVDYALDYLYKKFSYTKSHLLVMPDSTDKPDRIVYTGRDYEDVIKEMEDKYPDVTKWSINSKIKESLRRYKMDVNNESIKEKIADLSQLRQAYLRKQYTQYEDTQLAWKVLAADEEIKNYADMKDMREQSYRKKEAMLEELRYRGLKGTEYHFKPGETSLEEIKKLFNDTNSDLMNEDLFKQVTDIISKLKMNIVFNEKIPTSTGGQAAGKVVEYNWKFMNSDWITDQLKADTILHEMIHTVSSYCFWTLQRDEEHILGPELADVAKEFVNLYNSVCGNTAFVHSNYTDYGMKDEHEMAAELGSNEAFRKDMEKIDVWVKSRSGQIMFYTQEVDGAKKFTAYDLALERLLEMIKLFNEKAWTETYRGSMYGEYAYSKNPEVTDEKDFFQHAQNVVDQNRVGAVNGNENAITETARSLNTPVQILNTEEDIDKLDWLLPSEKRYLKEKGMAVYDPNTGNVVAYLPHIRNAKDATMAVMHEVVGHKGLRDMFGADAYDSAMQSLFNNLPAQVRNQVMTLASRSYNGNAIVAMDEYLAQKAQTNETPTWWQKVKASIKGLIREKLGISLEVSDNDVKYLLWQSQNQLRKGDILGEAAQRVMRKKLGINTVEDNNDDDPNTPKGGPSGSTKGDGVRFMSIDQTSNSSSVKKYYDDLMDSFRLRAKESMVDYLAPIKEFQKILAKTSGTEIRDSQDVDRIMAGLSSKNAMQMKAFDSSFGWTLGKAISKIIGKETKWSRESQSDGYFLKRYCAAKHGIERNRDMAVLQKIKEESELAFSDQLEVYEANIQQERSRLLGEIADKMAERRTLEEQAKQAKQAWEDLRARGADKADIKDAADKWHDLNQQIAVNQSETAPLRKALVPLNANIRDIEAFPTKYGLQTLDEIRTEKLDKWQSAVINARENCKKAKLSWRQTQESLDKMAVDRFGADLSQEFSGLGTTFDEDMADNGVDARTAAYDAVEAYEGSHNAEDLENLWKAIRAVTSFSLNKQWETGLVDQDYVENNLRRFEFFVPLRGFEAKSSDEMYDYLADAHFEMGSPVKSAKGRTSEPGNVFGFMIDVALRSISSGNRNLAKQAFLNLVEGHDSKGLAVVDTPWVVNMGTYRDPDWQLVEQDEDQLRKLGISALAEGDSPEVIAQKLESFNNKMEELRKIGMAKHLRNGQPNPPYRVVPSGNKSHHLVHVKIGGKDRVVTITANPRVAMAVNGELNPEGGSAIFERGMKKVNNFMASAFTSNNVSFSAANLVRDTLHSNARAFIMENPKYWALFTANQEALGLTEKSKVGLAVNAGVSVATLGASQVAETTQGVIRNWGKMMALLADYEMSVDPSIANQYGISDETGDARHPKLKKGFAKLLGGLPNFLTGVSAEDKALFRQFMDNGGATGYTMIRNEEKCLEFVSDLLDNLGKGRAAKIWDFVSPAQFFELSSFLGESSELVNRFIAFKTSRQMGRSITRSISDAKEITLNFSRKGSGEKGSTKIKKETDGFWEGVGEKMRYNGINTMASISQFGRKYIVFWNAHIQGSYQLYDMLVHHGWASTAKTLYVYGGSMAVGGGMIMPILNTLLLPAFYGMLGCGGGDDDDYYDSLSNWDRQHNLCFKLPKGYGWAKIPLTPELASMYALGDAIGASLRGKHEFDYASDGLANLVGLVEPTTINYNDGVMGATSFVPSALVSGVHIAMNKDFRGHPLRKENYNNQYDPEFKKVYRSASPTLIWLSKQMNYATGGNDYDIGWKWANINPASMKEFFTGMAGGYATTALALSDILFENGSSSIDERNIPVWGRFHISGSRGHLNEQTRSLYYEEVKKFCDRVANKETKITKDYDAAYDGKDDMEFARMEKIYDDFYNSDEFQKYDMMLESVEYVDDMLKQYDDADMPKDVIDTMKELIELKRQK